MKRFGFVVVIFATLAATFALASGDADASRRSDRTYRVTFTNDTEAQWMTPPNLASHGRDRLFGYGRVASPGIVAVAENGQPPVLQAEWAALGLDSFVGSGAAVNADGEGPIPPGGSRTFEITTNDRRFSVVSMIICTNDGFAGINSRRLPARMGETTNDVLRSYDAGSEINTENDADFVPAPFCGDPAVGNGQSDPALAENGRIRGHRGIQGVGDAPDMYDFGRFVGNVEITRIG